MVDPGLYPNCGLHFSFSLTYKFNIVTFREYTSGGMHTIFIFLVLFWLPVNLAFCVRSCLKRSQHSSRSLKTLCEKTLCLLSRKGLQKTSWYGPKLRKERQSFHYLNCIIYYEYYTPETQNLKCHFTIMWTPQTFNHILFSTITKPNNSINQAINNRILLP